MNDHLPNTGRTTVVFATRGRPECLAQAVGALSNQVTLPDLVVVCATSAADIGRKLEAPFPVTTILAAPGLPVQRNAGLAYALPRSDYVVFFDDDFCPSRYWLQRMLDAFSHNPQVFCLTGAVIADGIKGKGIDWDSARSIVREHDERGVADERLTYGKSPYGCNMAFRAAAIGEFRFDERLVLYGWQEDRDFAAGVKRATGYQFAKANALTGVHLGIKHGRLNSRKLGYSQVVNPIYLWRKGNMSLPNVAWHIGKNVTANLWGSIARDEYVHRPSRLSGNLLGLSHVVRGRVSPEGALDA